MFDSSDKIKWNWYSRRTLNTINRMQNYLAYSMLFAKKKQQRSKINKNYVLQSPNLAHETLQNGDIVIAQSAPYKEWYNDWVNFLTRVRKYYGSACSILNWVLYKFGFDIACIKADWFTKDIILFVFISVNFKRNMQQIPAKPI